MYLTPAQIKGRIKNIPWEFSRLKFPLKCAALLLLNCYLSEPIVIIINKIHEKNFLLYLNKKMIQ